MTTWESILKKDPHLENITESLGIYVTWISQFSNIYDFIVHWNNIFSLGKWSVSLKYQPSFHSVGEWSPNYRFFHSPAMVLHGAHHTSLNWTFIEVSKHHQDKQHTKRKNLRIKRHLANMASQLPFVEMGLRDKGDMFVQSNHKVPLELFIDQ